MQTIDAPAKINLSLEIVGRRDNGLHAIVSVMRTIGLSDTLTFTPAPDLILSCSDRQLETRDNLVLVAAQLLKDSQQASGGARVHLEKRIPRAAGLGGGSSDSASTLLALTQLWNLHLTRQQLMPLAARIGSDVPFFLEGGTCLVEGSGEQVTKLPEPTPAHYLLVSPRMQVATGDTYAALSPEEWTDGSDTRRLAVAIQRGERPSFGKNGLQDVLFRFHPEARECYELVRETVGDRVIVSGSGPTVVAEVKSAEEARDHAESLEQHGYWTAATTAVA